MSSAIPTDVVSKPTSKAACFRHPTHVIVSSNGDTTVLLDLRRGMYYTLNGIGGTIWRLLGQGASEDTIAQQLLDEYEVSEQRLQEDVTRTVERLLDAGLIASAEMP
jgi:hypothetical protein